MSINFTKNIEQYTTTNKNTRVKHFTEYTSKKQLQDACVLDDATLAFATSIKGTFNYALHEDGRYMAVTLYKATNNERKYNFLILDLQEQAVAEVNSIREAKAEILELAEALKAVHINKEEQEDINEDAPADAPAEDQEQETNSGSKKHKK